MHSTKILLAYRFANVIIEKAAIQLQFHAAQSLYLMQNVKIIILLY